MIDPKLSVFHKYRQDNINYYNLIGWISVIFLCTSTLCIWAIILIIKLLIKYELIQ